MPSKEHLTFESQTPAFLRRLRGEVPSNGPTDPDRHATPQVRARLARDPADIEDDEPVYVDAETGDVLVKGDLRRETDVDADMAAFASGNASTDLAAAKGDALDLEGEDSSAVNRVKAGEIVAGAGSGRRKGLGPKVVGRRDDDDATTTTTADDGVGTGSGDHRGTSSSTAKRKAGAEADSTSESTGISAARGAKVKKKAKKIKLSFNDDE